MRKHLLVVPKCISGPLNEDYCVRFFGNKEDATEYAFICRLAGYCVDIMNLAEYESAMVYKYKELEFEL